MFDAASSKHVKLHTALDSGSLNKYMLTGTHKRPLTVVQSYQETAVSIHSV